MSASPASQRPHQKVATPTPIPLLTRPFQASLMIQTEEIPNEVEETIDDLMQGTEIVTRCEDVVDNLMHCANSMDPKDIEPHQSFLLDFVTSADKNVFGETLHSMDGDELFEYAMDKTLHYKNFRLLVHALETEGVSLLHCFKETGPHENEKERWKEFSNWRRETSYRAKVSFMLRVVQVLAKLKLFVVRFRARVHAPGGVLYDQSHKRFHAAQ